MATKPPPSIPTLQGDTIDLVELGDKDLEAYIRYDTDDNMDGDSVTLSWTGRTPASDALDFESLKVRIDKNTLQPEGLLMEIPNDVVTGIRDGQAFYSYTVETPSGVTDESKRLLVFVGQRPPPLSRLPVPQVKDAHRGHFDPDRPNAARSVVPPYYAMSANDRVALTWQGYQPDGTPLTQYRNTKTLRDQDVGRPLNWTIAETYFSGAKGGRIEVSYTVTYQATGQTESSRLQLTALAPTVPWLEALKVRDLTGDTLDPSAFPAGAFIDIAPYDDIQVGDDLLFYWSASRESNNDIQHARIDQSNIDSGKISFHVDRSLLDANIGTDVNLTYQFARVGATASSETLALSIATPLKLGEPSVLEARPVGGVSTLDPLSVTLVGATVRVPANPGLGPADEINVVWDGLGTTGYFETTTPLAGNELDYRIPATAIPANMGENIDVYYTVTRPGMPLVTSDIHRLSIEKIPIGRLSQLQCQESASTPGQLSLKTATAAGGAHLSLEPWVYIAAGQTVSMQLSGVGHDGSSAVEDDILRDYEVTASDVISGVNNAVLPMTTLLKLKVDESFDVYVEVRFDDARPATRFPILKLQLID